MLCTSTLYRFSNDFQDKRADQNRTCVFLDEEQYQMFRDYNEFVRILIIKRTASNDKRFFFLTLLRIHYSSVSDGLKNRHLKKLYFCVKWIYL